MKPPGKTDPVEILVCPNCGWATTIWDPLVEIVRPKDPKTLTGIRDKGRIGSRCPQCKYVTYLSSGVALDPLEEDDS